MILKRAAGVHTTVVISNHLTELKFYRVHSSLRRKSVAADNRDFTRAAKRLTLVIPDYNKVISGLIQTTGSSRKL